jgi:hypothetical protein
MLIAAWGLIETHRATIEANRAWVGPISMELESSLESGKPINFALHLVNFGREPALGAVWKWDARLAPYVPAEGPDTSTFGANNACDGIEPNPNGGVSIYPLGGPQYFWPDDLSRVSEYQKWEEAVLARRGTLVIEGCVAYLTMASKHTSAFRFFLRDIPGQPSYVPSQPDKPGSGSRWPFNQALDGNYSN